MLATVAPLSTFAQKEVKEIRAAIKAKKPADALRLIAKQRKDSLNSCNARIYYLGVEAALLQSEKKMNVFTCNKSQIRQPYFKA